MQWSCCTFVTLQRALCAFTKLHSMATLPRLLVRDDSTYKNHSVTPTMLNLLIALLVLTLIAFTMVLVLFVMRSRRRARKNAGLPVYGDKAASMLDHHRLTVTTTPYNGRCQSLHVYNEKMNLIENSCSPPSSPDSIPEIRITFPEEEDAYGKRKSGRVVVVHVGDTGVGLEPVVEEPLPPYRRTEEGRFESIDLERIGGLKER